MSEVGAQAQLCITGVNDLFFYIILASWVFLSLGLSWMSYTEPVYGIAYFFNCPLCPKTSPQLLQFFYWDSAVLFCSKLQKCAVDYKTYSIFPFT